MKDMEYENESGEYIPAYDKCVAFGTYDSLQKGAKANSAQNREEVRASKGKGGYGEKLGKREQRKGEGGTRGRKHRS